MELEKKVTKLTVMFFNTLTVKTVQNNVSQAQVPQFKLQTTKTLKKLTDSTVINNNNYYYLIAPMTLQVFIANNITA